MANYGANLRRMFGNSQRKVRSNAGIKRGPRPGSKKYAANTAKAFAALPGSNVIVASNGGEVHVHNKPLPVNNAIGLAGMKIVGQRKTRSNKGVKRVAAIANAIGLAGMKLVGQRKTRSNKGVARPNRARANSKAAKTRKLRALARNVLGLSRVPRKGSIARIELNRLM